MSILKKIIFWTSILIIAATTAGYSYKDWFEEEKVFYIKGCINDNCSKVELWKIVFRVLRDKQQVIAWAPGYEGVPTRYENCAVRDANNFSCTSEDSSYVIVNNGSITMSPPPYANTHFISVWEWRYEKLKLWKNKTSGLLSLAFTILAGLSIVIFIFVLIKDLIEKRKPPPAL